MSLCSLCQSIPFSKLPTALEPVSISYIAGNRALVNLWYTREDPLPEGHLGLPWHEHLDALAQSAAAGCPLCAIVQAGIETWTSHYNHEAENNESFKEFEMQRMLIPERQRLYLTKRFGGAAGFLVLVPHPASVKLVNLMTGVGFSVNRESPLANTYRLRPPVTDSGSVDSLNVASSLFTNCIDNHEECLKGDVPLPSRVLDVGSSGNTFKLIDGEDLTGRYASLSYCWGDSPDFITSQELKDARDSGIGLSDLPKTFQDAVIISRHLGICYLWIDSLCISQGDDWTRDSSRLIDVYSKAHVVISADHAADTSIGCFHEREVPHSAVINFNPAGAEAPSAIQATLVNPHCEHPIFKGTFGSEPLSQCGWALQERVLSRRNLHYCRDQLYFECNHGILGENGCYVDRRFCDINKAYEPEAAKFRPPLHDGHRLLWNSVLREYGRRKLSQPTDKLPAMSGIARLFQERLGAEYVAGLWSDTLIEGLAWQCFKDRSPLDDAVYTGPSWSWAGYRGIAATGLRQDWKDSAEVLEWHVDHKDVSKPYGEVKNAWIRLRAPLIKLVASDKRDTAYEARLKTAGLNPLPRLRTKYSNDEEGSIASPDNENDRTSEKWRELDLYVLLLGWYPESEGGTCSRGGCSNDPCFGLVVTTVEQDHGTERMKRIGWMFLPGQEGLKARDEQENYTTVTLV